jgi:signal transduction histidine kinase
MIRLWPSRTRLMADLGWAAASRPVRAGTIAVAMLGLVAVAAQLISLASSGSQVWATDLAWALSAAVACAVTLFAGLRVRGNPVIRQTWLLYALGAGLWTIGALIRIITPAGQESIVADFFFLGFPVCCITTYIRRVPRPYLFLLFVLDAIPVILLILALTMAVEGSPEGEAFASLFTGLYVLLAANAIQMIGIHLDLWHLPVRIWMFTLAFCVMAFASLFAEPHEAISGNVLALWVGAVWTLGLLLLAAAGVGRVLRPSGFVVLLPVEKQSGPHAVPPAIAVLGLIVLMTLTLQPSPELRVFVFTAALLLLIRVYLVHSQDVQLVAEIESARGRLEIAAEAERTRAERLRRLAEVTSRLKSLILDELLQTFCSTARELLGGRYAAVGLAMENSGITHFVTSGPDQPARAGTPEPQPWERPADTMLRPDHPARLTGLTQQPEQAGFRSGRPMPEGFLGVPVAVGDSGRGTLYLAGKPGGFSEEDETLAELLATSGGHAIVNAELYAESTRQQEQLAAQNERLRELDRLKDEFIALVSHELRTPLTSIIGYIELLRDEGFAGMTEDHWHFTEVIDRNAHRLLRLVGDLLFLSRVQSGKMDMDIRGSDLGEIAERAVEEARPQAEAKQVDLVLSAAPLPGLECDPTRMAQLLDNLISNALKFTPEGGRVEVRLGPDGDGVMLEVADTGIGISAEDQERIFERFFRSAVATQQAVPGTGLGLTITKAIVEAHGGTITVNSPDGGGTTFRIWLPLHRASATDAPGPAEGHSAPR